MIKQFTFGSESGQRFKLKVNECNISIVRGSTRDFRASD